MNNNDTNGIYTEFLFGTSISPNEIEKQKWAIKSWNDAGVSIISCNIAEEIKILKHEFPFVKFVEVQRDGRNNYGRPYVYIYDIIWNLVKNSSDKTVCAIINSDIFLKNFDDNIKNTIFTEIKNTMIYVHRQDVKNKSNLDEYATYTVGIDIMFFERNMIDILEDDGFVLGQATWDYWLPLLAEIRGKRIVELKNPIAFHIEHQIKWSEELNRVNCKRIGEKYLSVNENAGDSFLKKMWKIYADPNACICSSPTEVKLKKVLILASNVGEKTLESIKKQSHQNFQIYTKNEEKDDILEDTDADYILKVRDGIIYKRVFLEMLIEYILKTNSDAVCASFAITSIDTSWQYGDIWIRDERFDAFLDKSFENILFKRQKFVIEPKNNRCEKMKITLMNMDMTYSMKKELNLQGTNNVFVMPAGKAATTFIEQNTAKKMGLNIMGYIDNNYNLQGKYIGDYYVYSVNEVVNKSDYDKIVIISTIYGEEIYKQLTEIISSEKVVII